MPSGYSHDGDTPTSEEGKGDSSTSQPSTAPSSQGPKGGNGGPKRTFSVTRKQLPKLVGFRGRHRMRPDPNFNSNSMAESGKSPVPPPVPPSISSSSIGANGVNSINGNGSSSSSNGGGFLFPPSSPALAAPRTPDYSPPPSPLPYATNTDERGELDVVSMPRAPKTPRTSNAFPDKNGGSVVDSTSLVHDKNNPTRGDGDGGASAAAAAVDVSTTATAERGERCPVALPKPRPPQPPVKPRPPATPRPPPPRPYTGKEKGPSISAPTAPSSPTAGRGTVFAPSSSPATFTPTASPARFTPTASPATRPAAYSPTTSPASKGATPTPAGQPRFTPTGSPASFTARSGNGAFEVTRAN